MREKLTSIGTSVRFTQELALLRQSLTDRIQKEGKGSSYPPSSYCQEVTPSQSNQSPSSTVSDFNNSPMKSFGSKPLKDSIISAAELLKNEKILLEKECEEKAHPLLYTREELKILLLGTENGVTNEIRAGIIWHAIERERKKERPPKSSSILKLLLSPNIDKMDESELNGNIFNLFDDDAIIVHTIDVVLSHYALDTRKINPFESWAGAWDKSIGVGKGNNKSDDGSVESWWRSYYSKKVLGSTKNFRNNVKMNKGHKITACLLHWAKHMQLNERKRWGTIYDINSFENDEFPPLELPNDIEFVSEVMRLLVARWLEASTDSTGAVVGLKKRGQRKRTGGGKQTPSKRSSKSRISETKGSARKQRKK